MNKSKTLLIILIITIPLLYGFDVFAHIVYDNKGNSQRNYIVEEYEPILRIREGYISQKKEKIKVKRNDKVVAVIKLGKPVIVAQADTVESWGYFQFPCIYQYNDDPLIVGWQMATDSHTAYGDGGNGRMMSKNRGRTWKPLDANYFQKASHRVDMSNGDVIHISTPSRRINNYASFPKSINKAPINDHYFYLEAELPEDLRGVYLYHRDCKSQTSKLIHGELRDPGLLRYAIDNIMSVVWWGDIQELVDGSLVAGIYPGYYADKAGNVNEYGVSFYKTTDRGHHWDILGKIPFQEDVRRFHSTIDEGIRGFSEPAFSVLKNGTFLCVMRTGFDTPMYKSISIDGGKHWGTAVPFTSNGVAPKLLQLDNGVIVLTSGRPGVQLRFCIEGDGEYWTEPIDMIPFLDVDGNYTMTLRKMPTCGYTDIMAVNDHTFYMVYSDFTLKNKEGQKRKTIVFRKIEVIKK